MSTKKKKIDIVTGNNPLKELLRYRLFEGLKLTYANIISNSEEDGISGINKANLSKYFGHNKAMSGSISQKSLLYLVTRYGIILSLKVSLKEYNEKDCKQEVKRKFNG